MADIPPQTARHGRMLLPMAVLAVVVGTCATVDGLARHPGLKKKLIANEVAACADVNGLWRPSGYYSDPDEYLLLDEMPAADYSAGSVCFIGSSSVKFGMMLWALPPEQRARINNFAFIGASHTEQFAFVRYLVEYEGLLDSKPADTHVVICASFHSGAFSADYGETYFAKTLTRHGLWEYDDTPPVEIRPVPMGRPERWVRSEKVRCQAFLEFVGDRLPYWLRGQPTKPCKPEIKTVERWTQLTHTFVKLISAEPKDIQENDEAPATLWRECIPRQVEQLRLMCDYLQARGARVTVVRLPHPTWVADLPYPVVYADELRRQGIAFIDKADAIADDKLFRDSSHVKFNGMKVFHDMLMEIAE